jgi:Cof subfamily protein (haloacid dehalogenase superfamily)
MKYRIIAMDLDDTLLRQDLSMSFRTRRTIKRAARKGAIIVLASGRIPASVKKFGTPLGMEKRHGYYLTHNGSLVLESVTKETIFEAKLPRETALRAFDLADAEGFPVQIYEDDGMLISRTNEYSSADIKLTGLKQVVAPNFRDLAAQGVYKLLIPGDPALLKPLLTIFQTYLGSEATLFTSKPYFLEILPPQVDKGAALKAIAEKESVPMEQVMAFGDSMNDEAMIRAAGCGVAMKNGSEDLKKLAQMTTRYSNEEDGVADIIERFAFD